MGNAFLMLSEIKQNGNWTFFKNMFCFHFAQFFGNVVFLKNLLFPYIFQNTSSPESCSAVLLFCNCVWKSWKKYLWRSSFSSIGPAAILKNVLFHFLFFKLFDSSYRRTILENTFWWLFLERLLPEKVLVLKVTSNVSYQISFDKRRA